MPTAPRVLNELPLNSTVKGVAPLFIQSGNLKINIVLGIVSQQLYDNRNFMPIKIILEHSKKLVWNVKMS